MPVASTFRRSLDHSGSGVEPFPHWFLNHVLPTETCAAIDALPVKIPVIEDTAGRRETHNSSRLFFGQAQRATYPVCDALAMTLQQDEVVRQLETLCDVDLLGSFLRIEYCLDTDGFWLEPHTDIGAKLFTMLIYLSADPGSEAWGTDILDGRETAERPGFPSLRPHCDIPAPHRPRRWAFCPGRSSIHGRYRPPPPRPA